MMFATILGYAVYLGLWLVAFITGYTAIHAVGLGYSSITGWHLLPLEVSAVLVGLGFFIVGVTDFLNPDAWDDDESGYEPSPCADLICGLACIAVGANFRVWQMPYAVTLICAVVTLVAAVRAMDLLYDERG